MELRPVEEASPVAEALPVFPSPVAQYLERLRTRYALVADGEVATYIPELAKADPSWFGICLVTVRGATYETGDTSVPFTIQSISKPLTYGIVLEDHGELAVRRRIGVEPSGDTFNSISLSPSTGTPVNAMINAGAIASVSLVTWAAGASPIDRILEVYSGYAGRPLSLDWTVYRSESATGHRNRAIGHLLRNSGVIEEDPEAVLQRYFQQCSVVVNCRDLAVIAGTLANGGVNPITGVRVAQEQTVRSILSVMTSCGMYDSAGEWLYSVGLPAKSGVSGGVLAVLPGHLGIGVFSPPLDMQGNSVRGVSVCRDISRDLNLHLVQSRGPAAPPIRSSYDVTQMSSKRRRSEEEREVLADVGARGVAFELQGELAFPEVEIVVGELIERAPTTEIALLDLRRVSRVDGSAVPILAGLAHGLATKRGQLVLSGVQRHADLVAGLNEELGSVEGVALLTFPELDLAVEWCENRLLEAADYDLDADEVPLTDHELLEGVDEQDLSRLETRLRLRRFEAGDLVLRRGDPADELFLITCGHLSVTVDLPTGERRRLATLSQGMVFGELAIMGGEPRTADVWADTSVECYALSSEEFARLGKTDPRLKCVLLENLLRIVGRVARKMNDELALLAG